MMTYVFVQGQPGNEGPSGPRGPSGPMVCNVEAFEYLKIARLSCRLRSQMKYLPNSAYIK